MRIEPTKPTQEKLDIPKKVNINKKVNIKTDDFNSILENYMKKPKETKTLTPQELLALDGLLLTDDEIIMLKSFLY